MTQKPCTANRRLFLTSGALVATLGWFHGPRLWAWGRARLYPEVEPLLRLLGDPALGVPAGQAYLAAYPDEANAQKLTRLIFPEGLPQDNSPRALRDRFQQQVRADFCAGRVVDAGGWVLAESEGRLLALAALWCG